MKVTATLYDIIESELQNKGLNEFYDCEHVDLGNGDMAFLNKVFAYDEDVQEIVNRMFFRNYKLPMGNNHHKIDEVFKKTFLMKFFDRQINAQTVEAFAGKLLYQMYTLEFYIVNLYDNADDFLVGQMLALDTNIHDNRFANNELPQDLINLDVDNTILPYANQNSISRDKTNNKSDRSQFDLDTLSKMFSVYQRIFTTIDYNCFLQVH